MQDITIYDKLYGRAMIYGTNYNHHAPNSRKLSISTLFNKIIVEGLNSLESKLNDRLDNKIKSKKG